MSKVPFKLIDNAADLREYVSRINYALPMAQDTESTGLSVNAILLGKSFYQKGSESVFVQMQTPFWEEGVSHKEAHEILNPVY